MRVHKRSAVLTTLVIGMASGVTAWGSDLPKQGTDSFTNTWVGTLTSSIKAGDRSFVTVELTGTTRNDAGGEMFNYVGQHCVGSSETIVGKESLNFLCTYTDKDGDQIFTTSDGEGPSPVRHGTEKPVGGTGKFAGITGTGEWTAYATPIKADDKAFRGVVSIKINWKLP